MNQLKKNLESHTIGSTSKQEVKEFIISAFRGAFAHTGVNAKDFTWFSDKILNQN